MSKVEREEMPEELSIEGKLIHMVFEFTRVFISENEAKQLLSLKAGNRTLKELIELDEQGKLLEKAENQELPKVSQYVRWEDRETARDYGRDMLTPRDGEVWAKVKVEEE